MRPLGSGRDAAEADGGSPAPARGHRRGLPPVDVRVPRFEPGPALALCARVDLSGLLESCARPADLRRSWFLFWSLCYLVFRCLFELLSLSRRSEGFKELEIV